VASVLLNGPHGLSSHEGQPGRNPCRVHKSDPRQHVLVNPGSHSFETQLLAREENLVGLMAMNSEVIGQAEMLDRSDSTVLHMDFGEGSVVPTRKSICQPIGTFCAAI
jgi:hypothetical protein